MPKGNFFSDTADDLLEFGISTAKSIPTNIAKTFNPLQGANEKKNDFSKPGGEDIEKLKKMEKNPNSTDLNLQHLEEKYKNQDKVKIEAMKGRLFKRVKDEEEKAILERKREEEERKRNVLTEEDEKKRKQQEELQQQSMSDAPRGKVKLAPGMTHQKAVSDTRTELKGNKGGA